MQLSEVFVRLGESEFQSLLRGISMGKLRSYQIFDHFKARTRLAKLNTENLRKAAPRLWQRLQAGEEDLAADLSQAILLSQLDLIADVLNFLEIPHQDGFFNKELDASAYLQEGWREKVWEKFREKYAHSPLLFYINHLSWELEKAETPFLP